MCSAPTFSAQLLVPRLERTRGRVLRNCGREDSQTERVTSKRRCAAVLVSTSGRCYSSSQLAYPKPTVALRRGKTRQQRAARLLELTLCSKHTQFWKMVPVLMRLQEEYDYIDQNGLTINRTRRGGLRAQLCREQHTGSTQYIIQR